MAFIGDKLRCEDRSRKWRNVTSGEELRVSDEVGFTEFVFARLYVTSTHHHPLISCGDLALYTDRYENPFEYEASLPII
jgi:hypothetical protein